jgi:membrane-bound lytic murein transglycosylase D
MNIKKSAVSLLLLVSIPLFSQNLVESKGIINLESNLSYLDSVKNTFERDNMAFCVDSVWMNELTNLDLYNEINYDIENIDIDKKVDYEELTTELLKSRLAEMNTKSPFRIEYNQSLENVIKSYLKYRKRSFERLMAISEYYFPLFEEAFAKQNVPLEIKYLAVVESALNPKAVSRMGATGLWQFMYQTGKQYNLKIDSYIDERSDPLKSSAAAAKYMSNMYSVFGDWELVLASYNSGPGNVSKAIRRSGGKQNYWNIRKHLPRETRGYVPAFLATMYLYEYHNEHGIIPDRALVQHFATDTIMIKKKMSFTQISELLDVPVSQLQILNPSYKLDVIPFYGDEDHYLRLPKEKTGVFASNEDKIYAYVEHELDLIERPFNSSRTTVSKEKINSNSQRITRTRTKYYKIKRGDNLGAIANKYDVKVSDLKRWNKLRSNAIAYGKSLKIITTESIVKTIVKKAKLESVSKESILQNQRVVITQLKNATGEEEENEIKKDTVYTNRKTLYVVRKGDNLASISKKFGTSLQDLKEWNDLSGNIIAVGSSLTVAKNEAAIHSDKLTVNSLMNKHSTITISAKKGVDYYVKKGDSLYSIAKKYPGVSISDLKKWNDIRSEKIKPGMKLKING